MQPSRLTGAPGLMLALPLAAATRGSEPRPDPSVAPPSPSYVRRIEPAVVRIRVRVLADSPSALVLGLERAGSGVIFDPGGCALTVSYVLVEAAQIEVTLRDGKSVPAELVGLDLEAGLGVVKLVGPGPWPTAALGDSTGVGVGQRAATVGVAEDNVLVVTDGSVTETRRFAGYWEYMPERAFLVSPDNPAFGGSPLVNPQGEVIGIASLGLGEPPAVNLAIPLETFVPGKDELLRSGRVVSRKPRPWLGLYTFPAEGGGVVMRGGRFEAIAVRPADRYRVFRTTGKGRR